MHVTNMKELLFTLCLSLSPNQWLATGISHLL